MSITLLPIIIFISEISKFKQKIFFYELLNMNLREKTSTDGRYGEWNINIKLKWIVWIEYEKTELEIR